MPPGHGGRATTGRRPTASRGSMKNTSVSPSSACSSGSPTRSASDSPLSVAIGVSSVATARDGDHQRPVRGPPGRPQRDREHPEGRSRGQHHHRVHDERVDGQAEDGVEHGLSMHRPPPLASYAVTPPIRPSERPATQPPGAVACRVTTKGSRRPGAGPCRLADAADRLTLARFGALDLHVETKPDLTPVSDADRDAERALRDILGRERPADAVHGEEFGVTGSATRLWVLDPIDGTKNFVRGVPVWATLVALVIDGAPVVGVVSAPALGRRWWGASGLGAWVREPGAEEPRRLEVSGVTALADASLAYSRPGRLGRPRRALPRPARRGLAHPRLRRLLVAHAGGRGGRGHRHRARALAVGHRRARPGRSRRRAARSPGGMARRRCRRGRP